MSRDLKFDNLRGLAITLIVLGHFAVLNNQFIDSAAYNFIDKFVCLIPFPLSIFISGYFSKVIPDSAVRAFKGIFIPYLIFETLWMIVPFLKTRTLHHSMYFLPEVGLWYLLSLFFWRALLPVVHKAKHVLWIIILSALLIGIINFNLGILSISRTLCYFPVFLSGFYFNHLKEKLVLNKYLAAGALATLLAAISIGFALHDPDRSNQFLSLKVSYSSMGMGIVEGMILRLIVIFVGIIGSVLTFNIVTPRETFLTKIGRNSLPVYVLHFYFVFYLPHILKLAALGFIFNSYILTTIYVVSATIVVTFILSRNKVSQIVNNLINNVTNLLIAMYKLPRKISSPHVPESVGRSDSETYD